MFILSRRDFSCYRFSLSSFSSFGYRYPYHVLQVLLLLGATLDLSISVPSVIIPVNKTGSVPPTPNRENCQLHGIHLAYGNTVHDMVVVWSTVVNCTSQVRYGKHPKILNNTVSSKVVYFNESNPLGRHYLYRAELYNLTPDTLYYYYISNSYHVGITRYFNIPPNGTNWSPSFILFGDLGIQSHIHTVLTNEIRNGKYSAIFHVGDFGYDLESNGGTVGDSFMDIIEDYASYIAYMTAPGNHEINGGNFSHYRYRFSMPQTKWPMTVNKLWYSFDIGPIHFISYSTEAYFTNPQTDGAAQSAWLIKDLKEANLNRKKRPWIVAYGHRPMYCSNTDFDDCTKNNSVVREHLESIFYIGGVDIIFEAHEHSYERLYPVYDNKVMSYNYTNPLAPIHIITGAAGNKYNSDPMNGPKVNQTTTSSPSLNTTANQTSTPKTSVNISAKWTAFRQSEGSLNSYGKFTVYNESHLFWEQIQNGDILDSIWVVKEQHTTNNVSKEFKQKVIDKVMEQFPEMTTNSDLSNFGPSDDDLADDAYLHLIVIALSIGGALALIFIMAYIVIRNHRKKGVTVKHWNDNVYVKKSFYRNIKNLENELMCDDLDVSDGTLPTSKLLSEHSEI